MTEYIFSDLPKLTQNSDNLSSDWEFGKWKTAEYTTGKCVGKMLVAPEKEKPGQVELNLGLSGIYEIYLCIPRFRQENYIYVKLSDDLCVSGIKAIDKNRPNHWLWADEEYLEEVYWRTADLTGQSVIIDKPDGIFNTTAGIAWIRCVRVDSEEKKPENRFIQYHMDEDYFAEDSFLNDNDYLIRLAKIKDTNAEMFLYEVSFDYDVPEEPKCPHLWAMDERWDRGGFDALNRKDMIYKRAVEFAHENGIKIYATNRMQPSGFFMPYTRFSWDKKFISENPDFYLKTRIGTTVKIASYAYKEVRDYMVTNLVEALKYGFDGLSLCYIRGTHIGFDEPVIKRFKELYPNVNPYVLPMNDERLNGVMCGFMNEFMVSLRQAVNEKVGKHIKINVITDYGPETSKHYGIDVEYWAKNGLVDSISQMDMETFEVLDGCMSEENPDIIDLDKYREMLKYRPVVRRKYGFDLEKLLENFSVYLEIGKKYKVDIYATMPNVRGFESRAEFYDALEKMKKNGAEKFLSWNSSHLSCFLPEWHTTTRVGNETEEYKKERKFHRVLSLDDTDISQFNPNWRG